MRLIWRHTYSGPNPWADEAAVVADLELSADEGGAMSALCAPFVGHFSEWMAPGGAAWLGEGVSPATRVAGVLGQWSLAVLNEVRGDLRVCGAVATPGGARLWLGWHVAELSRAVLGLALKTLARCGDAGFCAALVQPELERVWRMCRLHHPDYQAKILMQAARANGIPVLPFAPEFRVWQFGWGERSAAFFESNCNRNGALGDAYARSKAKGKAALAALGMPVAAHVLVTRPEDLARAQQAVGFPCVVKPLDRGGGKGVTAGIGNLERLHAAYAYARQFTAGAVMVEAFVEGTDHRLMVVDGRLVAVVQRTPTVLDGDGVRTVEALIDEVNRRRSRNVERSMSLEPILITPALVRHLGVQGLELQGVPELGQQVTLSSVSNVSQGGTLRVVTDVHPQVQSAAEAVANSLGLGVVGLDYITVDIGKDWSEVGGAFIEVNSTPSMKLLPDHMMAIGQAVLGPRPGRIPVVLWLTDDLGVDKVLDWLRQLPGQPGFGWRCGNQFGVGALCLSVPGSEPFAAVKALLRHQAVATAVLVCTVDEVVRHGLPVDRVGKLGVRSGRLSPPWLATLEHHAQQLTVCAPGLDDIAALQGLMADWPGE